MSLVLLAIVLCPLLVKPTIQNGERYLSPASTAGPVLIFFLVVTLTRQFCTFEDRTSFLGKTKFFLANYRWPELLLMVSLGNLCGDVWGAISDRVSPYGIGGAGFVDALLFLPLFAAVILYLVYRRKNFGCHSLPHIRRKLIEDGFIEISSGERGVAGMKNFSAIGASIFYSVSRTEVAKIGADPAYNVFAQFARRNPELHVPKIYEHWESGSSASHDYFTFTRLERLDELTEEEATKFSEWIIRVRNTQRAKKDLSSDDDPFNLVPTVLALSSVAENAVKDVEGFSGYDDKANNLMVRRAKCRREIIYIDPFH